MKKVTFLLVSLFAITIMQAQITLEHTFNYNLRVPHEVVDENGYTIGDIFAYNDDNGTLVCIDAVSYDEIARITIPDMKRYDMIAKNIYSTDGLIGFIARNNNGKNDGHAYVYNQNGIMLADLGECGFISIVQIGSDYKLIVYKYNEVMEIVDGVETYKSKYSTDVYSLPGNSNPTSINNVPAKHFAKPYPNPAHNIINLPYELSAESGQMQIFDINGRLVECRLISRSSDVLELNVQHYPVGLYFYKVEGTSQSFMVE